MCRHSRGRDDVESWDTYESMFLRKQSQNANSRSYGSESATHFMARAILASTVPLQAMNAVYVRDPPKVSPISTSPERSSLITSGQWNSIPVTFVSSLRL